jgi:HAD superfamily hydrolase (TIGR01509 family)
VSANRPVAVFDVDGTLVDSERHGHRVAFNDAFAAFDLPYVWDERTYGELLAIAGGQHRLRAYLQDRGHEAEEADRLAGELHRYKTERFRELCERGGIPPRPGVAELLDDLAAADATVGVATTGTREWVGPLLEHLFGIDRFALVLTGSEVPRRKPAGDVYEEACRQLRREPGEVVAVEDSANGLAAALAVGLPCLMVLNDYTREEDTTGAVLVLDTFRDATVLAGPGELLEAGAVTAGTIAGLSGRAATEPPTT